MRHIQPLSTLLLVFAKLITVRASETMTNVSNLELNGIDISASKMRHIKGVSLMLSSLCLVNTLSQHKQVLKLPCLYNFASFKKSTHFPFFNLSQMSSTSYFVTGGNRGIGLALVKELSSDAKNTVVATAREPNSANDLKDWAVKHPNVKIVQLDVSSSKSVEAAAEETAALLPDGLDVLVSNAGVLKDIGKYLDHPDELYIEQFNVNAVGPVRLVRAFKPLLDKKDTREVAVVSSLVGSLNVELPVGFSGYGVSKAAANYIVKGLIQELSPEGYSLVAVHPGLVGSDMGDDTFVQLGNEVSGQLKSALPLLTPGESAKAIKENVLTDLKAKNAGKFLSYEGSELPW
ncbi:LAME_0A00122g1_1 [Lachancea meyersii CBS 8951]|uniref:LAME_0A00122g1_1 n=1 Tax=Lachancea meyersii CBS 8951 TaxID=1266667 RepID=A0A1G4IL42_9SACH|nr:LAME_0A00122g1_1 [Lachancea meyersii CBS 8951]